MDSMDRNKTLERYNRRLTQFGYDPRTLGWNKKRQNLRFHVLLDHWPMAGKQILDLGCGFGDMYGFLIRKGWTGVYDGVDINENLIEKGKEIYPEAPLRVADVFKDGLSKTYDYCFSSGLHNFQVRDNLGFIKATFDLFNAHSREGFAANFLSNQVDYTVEGGYHADPAEILKLAYTYSNRVVLNNNYMPFEFTLFVSKRNDFDPRTVVFDDYRAFL